MVIARTPLLALTVGKETDNTNVSMQHPKDRSISHTKDPPPTMVSNTNCAMASSSSKPISSPKQARVKPSTSIQTIIPNPTTVFVDEQQVSPYNDSLKLWVVQTSLLNKTFCTNRRLKVILINYCLMWMKKQMFMHSAASFLLPPGVSTSLSKITHVSSAIQPWMTCNDLDCGSHCIDFLCMR